MLHLFDKCSIIKGIKATKKDLHVVGVIKDRDADKTTSNHPLDRKGSPLSIYHGVSGVLLRYNPSNDIARETGPLPLLLKF
jgi:hypothetical protein